MVVAAVAVSVSLARAAAARDGVSTSSRSAGRPSRSLRAASESRAVVRPVPGAPSTSCGPQPPASSAISR